MARIEIDTNSIFKFFLIVGGIGLAFLVYDILLLIFISYILMSAISPIVNQIEKTGLPRWLATLLAFILISLVLVGMAMVSLSPLASQTQNLIRAFPQFVSESIDQFQISGLITEQDLNLYLHNFVQSFSRDITVASGSILRLGIGVFGGFLDLIMVLIFSFYLLIEDKKVKASIQTISEVVGLKNKDRLGKLFEKVETKLGAWMRGQLLLMFLIGLISYVGLKIIGVPFALPLAFIAGFLEIVPILGPIVSAIPAILVALASSPMLALTTLFLYILIQQLENSIVVPRVMKNAVGLDPLVVIVALMIGGRILGPMGALLAVPTVAVLKILYQEWLLDEK